MKQPHLSERQQRILKFIHRFVREHGYPPTIREIGRAVDISSTSVVKYNLRKLESLGLLARDPTVSRGLRLTDEGRDLLTAWGIVAPSSDVRRIPLLGRIVAGEPIPIPASDFALMGADETVELARGLVPDDPDIFALEVHGDSMIDALINDGDIVVMKRVDGNPRPGDMVAVWLRNQEATTLKQFYLDGDKVRLQPANPTMEPIYEDPANVEVQGRVILVIRRLH